MRTGTGLRVIALVTVVFLVLGAWVASGCSQQNTQNGTQKTPAAPEITARVKDGGQLYVSYACVYCHGVGGSDNVPNPFNEGGDDMIPPLKGSDFSDEFKSDGAVAAMIKNGSVLNDGKATSMPAWNGILSDTQIESIVAYIRAGLPDVAATLPLTRTGSDVYKALACEKCHGPIGQGGVANQAATEPDDKQIPALGTADFHQEFNTPEKIRRMVIDGSVIENAKLKVVFMPRWGDVMTASQQELVTNWLNTYK